MMTWHETIEFIRTKKEFKNLVLKAYLHEDIVANVENFGESIEFKETIRLLNKYKKPQGRVLDVGSGNGITAVNFALKGYDVDSIEPDKSNSIGSGAIRTLINHYKLSNLRIKESYAEDLNFPKDTFDIIYFRQAMHHAYDLNKFILSTTQSLKKGGILVAIRDHVIFSDADKANFLKRHPLQKFYGGENAFKSEQYKAAFQIAGLKVIKEYKYYDSVINYFPKSSIFVQTLKILDAMLHYMYFIPNLLLSKEKKINYFLTDEKRIPGRMYSYICKKPS